MEKLNTKELFASLDKASSELVEMVTSFDEKKINLVPFTDSWTAAQLVAHVTKSNISIVQALDMQAKKPERDPNDRIEELKEIFLNFTIKFQSPDFISPAPVSYDKKALIANLKSSNERLKQQRENVRLSEIINLPAFGQISKLELLYFVLYHTQRHIHQLKNIIRAIKKN